MRATEEGQRFVSVIDDVLEDFRGAYPAELSRPDLEKLMQLLSQTAAPRGGMQVAVATAVNTVSPTMSERITSYSDDGEAIDYVRLMRSAVGATLESWSDPSGPPPGVDEIETAVRNIEEG